MRALVIYESLTGTTHKAAVLIAEQLVAQGWEASECSSKSVDLGALQRADVLVVGTWVDGLILFGQRPGGAGKLAKLPLLADKPTYLFVTYAVDAGKAVAKFTDLIESRDGNVRGAMAIRRDQLEDGCIALADGVVAAASKSIR